MFSVIWKGYALKHVSSLRRGASRHCSLSGYLAGEGRQVCISVHEWDYSGALTLCVCVCSQPSSLGRRLPHPEIRHIVPSVAHLEGSTAGRTKLFRVAGRLSLISIMSLSCVRGLYSGWRTNLEDMMCCSVPSGSHMLCSPSRTSKSALETLRSSGFIYPTPIYHFHI